MKSRSCGRKAIYWCIADAVAIAVAIVCPGWTFPVAAWLSVVATFVCCGRIPVRART